MAQETILIDFQIDYSQLTSAQEQLAKTGKIDDKGFQAIQSAINTTADDTKGLIKTFKDVAGASVKMGKTVEDAFGAGIQDALDEAGVSLGEFESHLKKANAPAITLKKELAQLKEAMARMKAEGKDTGKEFDSLRQRAGKLADAISDANAEIKNAGSDTRGIDNVVGSISALAGGYAAVQGAAALFGEENEDVQKALLKVNGAMALAQGLQVIYNASLKEGALAKLADSVITGTQTAAMTLLTFVTTGATVAARVYRAALLATGIGAIVVLVLSLVDAFSKHNDEVVDAKKRIDDLNDSYDKLSNTINRLNDEQAAIAQSQGAEESAILKIRLEGINKLISANRTLENEKRIAATKASKDGKTTQAIENEIIATFQEGLKLRGQVRILEAQIVAAEKKEAEDRIKAKEELDKKKEEAMEKARLKELAAIKEVVLANLQADQTRDEQMRISFDNRESIIEEGRAKEEEINAKWDKLRLEQMQSFTKSSEDEIKKRSDAEQAAHEKRIKNAQGLIGIAAKVADFYSQLSNLAAEQEKQRINDQKDQLHALEEAGAITEKQAKIRRQQIEIEERKAQQRQAAREKQAAIFGAIINTALAITNAIATGDPYTAAIRAAIAAALGAAQIAIISAKPIPKFFKGKKGNYEGPGEVADMGAELVERNGRMFLYTKPTQTYLGAKDKVYTAGETRTMLHNTNISTKVRPQPAAQFDYEKFGASIPKDRITIDFNRDYLSEAIENGLNKTNRFVTRYQFKR